MHDEKRDLLWQTRIITEVYFFCSENLKIPINKTFVRSVSIRNQISTISTVANQFIFYYCIISTVFQLFYCKNSSKKTIEPSKQPHNAKKTESIKTEQSVAIWLFWILLELQKFWKIRTTWVICILVYCKGMGILSPSDKKWELFSWAQKFLFSARSNQLSPNMIPKALLGTNTN